MKKRTVTLCDTRDKIENYALLPAHRLACAPYTVHDKGNVVILDFLWDFSFLGLRRRRRRRRRRRDASFAVCFAHFDMKKNPPC
jgi:hypothetical protein